jgi:DNA repair exonuclease SbcCD ATPase subunit
VRKRLQEQKNDIEDMCEKAIKLLENRNSGKGAENTAREEFISGLNRVIEDFESGITREKNELQALETKLQNITEQEEQLSNINNKTTDLQTDMKLEQIEQLQGKKITLEKKRIQLEINIEELQAKKICVENLLANNVELLDYLEVDKKLFKRTQKILEHLEKFKNILQNASEKRKKAGDSSREIDLLLKTIEDFSNAAAEEVYTRDAIISDFAVAKPGSEKKLEEALQLSSSEESHDLKGIEFITKKQIGELELEMLGVLSPEELNELTTFEKESLTVDTSTDKVKLPI